MLYDPFRPVVFRVEISGAKCKNGAVLMTEKCKFSNSVIGSFVAITVSQITVLILSCDAPLKL